ncbi:MAG: DUF3604 domain-containing protein [Parvibaculales bacterium]
MFQPKAFIGLAALTALAAILITPAAAEQRQTRLLWGDTHLHTSYSLDAYLLGNKSADPDTAYRFAKGLPVVHPGHRGRVRIDRPLDFLVVTDHAEFLGVFAEIDQGNPELLSQPMGQDIYQGLREGRENEIFSNIINMAAQDTDSLGILNAESIRRSIWGRMVDFADKHNEPGTFTSFAGWEWSSMPNSVNLHRIVFTPDGGDKAKSYLPFSSIDSTKPRDLWAWMDKTAQAHDTDFVAIGHNMNLSLGRFFPEVDESGNPVDRSYAEARARWEPVEEVIQYKGDSETHPLLSPLDEFAGFEKYEHLLGPTKLEDGTISIKATPAIGAFMRPALKRGLELESKIGINPYKFGVIGASDSHTALVSVEEENFHGKYANDSTPETKHLPTVPTSVGWDAAAQGLSAVWAEENTRDSITAAFRRREVYATSGPRIGLRVFGGWNFTAYDARKSDLAAVGYKKGVPMGGELNGTEKTRKLTLLIHAAKDPVGNDLERVQVVKGWLDENGKAQEKIYEAKRANVTKAEVDLAAGQTRHEGGAKQFTLTWQDPDFDPEQNAFYYVRVLEMPTYRHTILDAIALEADPEVTKHETVIRERAYSSPIWYNAN